MEVCETPLRETNLPSEVPSRHVVNGCGLCAMDCVADILSHTITERASDEKRAEVHDGYLVSDPLLPLLNSTVQEERDWWLIRCDDL